MIDEDAIRGEYEMIRGGWWSRWRGGRGSCSSDPASRARVNGKH